MTVRLITPTGNRPNNAAVVNSAVANVVNGAVIASDADALVASGPERPLGIMVDAVATTVENPRFYRLAVTGDFIFDTALTSQTEGVPLYSDGDGTYSVTRPTGGSAGDLAWMLGFIRGSDATGSIIEVDIQPAPEA